MGENVKQFIAGGVGGMAAVFSGHPLVTDKNLIHFMTDHFILHADKFYYIFHAHSPYNKSNVGESGMLVTL